MNNVPLDRFDKRLDHAVGLWRSYRREARHNTDRLDEGDGRVGAITAAVLREPVHRVRGLLIVKTPLDALEHRLAIAGIDCKGDTNALSVTAIAVRRPVIRQRSIGRQELGIIRLLVSPLRATPLAKTRVKLTTRDAERVGDRLHSETASSNNGNREISFSHRQLLQLLGEPRSPASSYPKPAQVAVCASRGR